MRWLAKTLARLLGWTLAPSPELPKKFVLIAAPHTSNWDGFFMVVGGIAYGLRPDWVLKHTFLKPPFGWFLKRLGAISIDRRKSSNKVKQLAARFAEHEAMALAIPPEGTRGKAPHWKSGFYFVAKEAKVPIVLGYLDYQHKQIGFGPLIQPGADTVKEDMDAIREFYRSDMAMFPEKCGPIRLEIESNPVPE